MKYKFPVLTGLRLAFQKVPREGLNRVQRLEAASVTRRYGLEPELYSLQLIRCWRFPNSISRSIDNYGCHQCVYN
jgi:hypothetical protein